MTTRFAIADVAALLGEPTRAAVVLALLDGRALPAGELARAARLSAPATSLHLAKLAGGGLLTARRAGRHRYYRLANENVAHALEALGAIATAAPPARSPLPGRAALRAARTCYDHLAGALGVALADVLERERVVRPAGDRTYAVSRAGARWLADALQVDVDALARASKRPVARRCLDWTERRPHLAGSLGAAVLGRLVADRWVVRVTGSRALRVTARGRAELARLGLPARVVADAS